MTKEKIYAELDAIRAIITDNNAPAALYRLETLQKQLLDDLRADSAKKSGTAAKLAAAKRILKNAPAHLDALQYAANINGAQYICDSFRAVKLADQLPLDQLPAEKKYIDIEKFFPAAPYDEALDLPAAAALKAYIKTQKELHKGERGYKIYFDFGEKLPVVDAAYLLDILEILPGAAATVKAVPNGFTNRNRLYFYDNTGNAAVLCPCNPAAGTRKRTEI